MPDTPTLKRVVLIANRLKPDVVSVLPEVREWLAQRSTIVCELDAVCDDQPAEALPSAHDADLAIVLGGDGTLLGQARRLVDTGIPLLGVNLGELGFLAEFDPDSLKEQADSIFGPNGLVLRERMLLEASIESAAARDAPAETDSDSDSDQDACAPGRFLALNDAVITSGPPFRMIELAIELDAIASATLKGDGLVVSTPAGSTGYGVSAGGPVVAPDVDCMIVTPIAAHSLGFRPFVVGSSRSLSVRVVRANPGTTLVMDGQTFAPLESGDRILLGRFERTVKLVANPAHSYWRTLIRKMHWAARPKRDPS